MVRLRVLEVELSIYLYLLPPTEMRDDDVDDDGFFFFLYFRNLINGFVLSVFFG